MFFEKTMPERHGGATRLTLQDLIAVQPRHVRGRLMPGRRGPDGERPGRGRSTTLDFDGLSPYVPGDDVRAIDWRATMRSGQVTMRRFAAASHRAHMLMVDLRPDLYFGTVDQTMAKTACLSAAWLAWHALVLDEPVGLVAGTTTLRPRRGRRHVLRLLDLLTEAYTREADGPGAPPDFEAAAALVGRQDELCLISDLPMEPGPLTATARALSRSLILRFVLVEDPFVTRAPAAGRYPVRGPDGRREVIRVAHARPPDITVRTQLRDAGWRVDRALDLLPRRSSQ